MKILVVEDEPLIRLGMVSLVEELGFPVLEAGDAAEAIGLMEAATDIRLVITDVDMPGTMDGLRLAHYVRKRWPPVQLIVVSGKVGVDPKQLPEGARFFSKPCRDDVLLAAVREIGAAGAGR